MGDFQGHPFRGNQWDNRAGEGAGSVASNVRGDHAPEVSGSAPTPDDDPTGTFSPQARARLVATERKIQSQTWETAQVLSADGMETFIKDGGNDYVAFSDDEAASMRGGVLTHNHPKSGTFSDHDERLLMSKGLREIRAVGRDGSIRRLGMYPQRPWTEEMFLTLKSLESDTVARTTKRIHAGEITEAQANAGWNDEHHAVLTAFAKAYAHLGVYYKYRRGHITPPPPPEPWVRPGKGKK